MSKCEKNSSRIVSKFLIVFDGSSLRPHKMDINIAIEEEDTVADDSVQDI